MIVLAVPRSIAISCVNENNPILYVICALPAAGRFAFICYALLGTSCVIRLRRYLLIFIVFQLLTFDFRLSVVCRPLSVVLLMFKMSESSSNHSLSVFVASIYGVLVFY